MVAETHALKILYIEDDRALARLLQKRLALDHITVDIANDAYIGTDMFQSGDYDLVAVDYDLPGTDGIELLRRWQEQRNNVPVIIITGQGNTQIAVEAMKLGAKDYIIKRANSHYISELPSIIRRAVDEHRELQRGKEYETQQSVALLKRNRHLLELNRASQNLASTLDSQKVMTQMLIAATTIVGAEDASIWVWEDSKKEHLVCSATSNLSMLPKLQKFRLAPGEGIVGWVAEHMKSTVVANTQTDARFSVQPDSETGYSTKSLLAVPLFYGDEILGVLEVLNKHGVPFDDEDMSLANTLATSAAIAMENAHLVEQLRAQTLELEARNEELDAFAHTVAHDLKTPLIWINGYADLLIEDDQHLDRASRLQYAESIMNGTSKMEQIIDELLLLASLRDATVVINAVDMQRVVAEAIDRLKYQIAENNATVTVVDSFPAIETYSPWIEGVFVNYMSNALKYGGNPPIIEVGFTDNLDDDFVWYWVQDNGAGIEAAKHDQLFVPFSRLDHLSTKRGHGVGLSIVRHIIEKLGGKVSVESQLGAGSRFMFGLPRQAQRPPHNGASETPPSVT